MNGLLLPIALLIIYFIPSIVGYSHKNAGAIIILNLFLGWTFIGWVAALIWAATDSGNKTEKQ